METIRKIDLYGQCTLGALMIVSIPILFLYGFGFGLLILGAWQFISATINTYSFTKSGMKKEIRNYWIFTVVSLLIFFSPDVLAGLLDEDDLPVFPAIGATGGAAIAIYYLWLYKKLIRILEYKSSIKGIVKN